MSAFLDRANMPPWTQYVVVPWTQSAEEVQIATCSSLELALACLRDNDLAFRADVYRFVDGKLVWPIHAKGGIA